MHGSAHTHASMHIPFSGTQAHSQHCGRWTWHFNMLDDLHRLNFFDCNLHNLLHMHDFFNCDVGVAISVKGTVGLESKNA
jgi:hypothetical protein